MKFPILLATVLLLPSLAQAKSTQRKPAEAKGDIICSFSGVNEDKNYGTMNVFLDANGIVTRLIFDRPKIEKAKAHLFDFQQHDSTITRVDKDLREKDEDGELYNHSGGPSFGEVIDAKNANGDRVVLRINDHSYSGTIGSGISAYVNGKMLADPGDVMGFCDGKIMHPDTRRQEMEAEMAKERADQEQGSSNGAK